MNGSTGLLPGVKLVEVGGLAVLAMGKRGNRSQSQLLGSLTKKQKKHLRDFGEEHAPTTLSATDPWYLLSTSGDGRPPFHQLSVPLPVSGIRE